MKKPLTRILKVLAITAITAGLGEVVGRVLLDRELKDNKEAATIFQYAFGSATAPQWDSLGYSEHHYLNYALNPLAKSGGKQQYNPEYKIRRASPIAERGSVTWRGLALGGSTAFGEGVVDEGATWVGVAEKLLSTSKGGTVEFINGGVPGYTLQENFIHYTTLLTHLQADVVVLYVGINDVHPRFFGSIKPDYSNYRRPWRSDGQVFDPTVPWLKPFSLYQLYYVRNHRARGLHIGGLVSLPYPGHHEWPAALTRNSSEIFEVNLRNLARLISSQNRKVVIVPQVFIPLSTSDQIFLRGVEEHNQVAERVARESNALFVAEMVTPQQFTKEDLRDNCHFNEKGSRKFAEILHKALVANNL